MRIWYLRPSVFETNSSSSHALVYTMDFVEVEPTESSFGWEYFFLKSRKWKLVYFASQVRCMYREESSQVFSSVFTKDELAELLSKDFEYEVDHQSVWPAFRTPDGRPAVEFLKELKESLPDPMTALARAWKFYRDNVDTNVCFNCVGIVGEHNVLAYKINDVFGWVKFYLISGLVVDFNWVSHGKTIAIDFYHLARPEESAY